MRTHTLLPETVHSALQFTATEVVRYSPSSWAMVLQNGKSIKARATLDEHWLTVSAPVNASREFAPWQLLSFNNSLPHGTRLTLDASHTPTLRIDSMIGGAHGVNDDVSRACAAIVESMSTLAGSESPAPEDPATAGYTNNEPLMDERLNLSAWHGTRLDDGTVRFDLAARNERYSAILEPVTDRLRCHVEVCAVRSLNEPTRDAMALALLHAANSIRLVRPTATTEQSLDRIGFEVINSRWDGDSDLDVALDALHCACRLLGRETRALTDPALATAYLAVVFQQETSHIPQRG